VAKSASVHYCLEQKSKGIPMSKALQTWYTLGWGEKSKFHDLSSEDSKRELREIEEEKESFISSKKELLKKLTAEYERLKSMKERGEVLDIIKIDLDHEQVAFDGAKGRRFQRTYKKTPTRQQRTSKKVTKRESPGKPLVDSEDYSEGSSSSDDSSFDDIAPTGGSKRRASQPERSAKSNSRLSQIMKDCGSFTDSDDSNDDGRVTPAAKVAKKKPDSLSSKLQENEAPVVKKPPTAKKPTAKKPTAKKPTEITLLGKRSRSASPANSRSSPANSRSSPSNSRSGRSFTPPVPSTPPPRVRDPSGAPSPYQVGDVVFVSKTANDRHQATILSRPDSTTGKVSVKWELRGGVEEVNVSECEVLDLSDGPKVRPRRNVKSAYRYTPTK